MISKHPINSIFPAKWEMYEDKDIGIIFKYPPDLEIIERGFDISLKSKDGAIVSSSININRYFGFGGQGGVENIIKQIGHDPNVKTISENGKTAVITFWPKYPGDKRLYVISGDALFDVELYNVDPNKFLKSLKFTKLQALAEYNIIPGEEFKIVVNQKHGYQIDIPNNLGVSFNSEGVVFQEPYYFYPSSYSSPIISITVASTSIKSVNDALYANYNKFEKNIIVDGSKGALGNLIDQYPNVKVVYVLKNGMLYTINVQGIEYEKVLAGFKFLNQ